MSPRPAAVEVSSQRMLDSEVGGELELRRAARHREGWVVLAVLRAGRRHRLAQVARGEDSPVVDSLEVKAVATPEVESLLVGSRVAGDRLGSFEPVAAGDRSVELLGLAGGDG